MAAHLVLHHPAHPCCATITVTAPGTISGHIWKPAPIRKLPLIVMWAEALHRHTASAPVSSARRRTASRWCDRLQARALHTHGAAALAQWREFVQEAPAPLQRRPPAQPLPQRCRTKRRSSPSPAGRPRPARTPARRPRPVSTTHMTAPYPPPRLPGGPRAIPPPPPRPLPSSDPRSAAPHCSSSPFSGRSCSSCRHRARP